jgi:hypothetical protein
MKRIPCELVDWLYAGTAPGLEETQLIRRPFCGGCEAVENLN